MKRPVAEFRAVSKSFKKGFLQRRQFFAVKDASLLIDEGETFCLIGPNGAGKTTLVRMMLDFIKPTSGSILLFGQPHTLPVVRDSVGYFPERGKYPANVTVEQFLKYWGKFSGLTGHRLTSKVQELLEFVTLTEKKSSSIKNLSKGMTVRVGLAQALLNDPKFLILDEPTDGLDPLGRIEFRDMLKKLKSEGKTIFINSHLLSEVEQISTRVGIMDAGKLIKVDTLENLLSSQSTSTIHFSCSSDETILKIRESFQVRPGKEGWDLVISDPNDFDRAIKLLAMVDVSIQSVDQQQGSLEKKFLSLIRPQL